MSEWYERWFGEEYLALYPHRDERDAAAAVALVVSQTGGRDFRRVLDLACGAGRHTRLLGARWWTVGVDLSPVLLKLARASEPERPYVRADMRVLPFAEGCFDLVVNLFTSFGYFAADEEHDTVIGEVARVLAPDGWFALDYLNAPYVRDSLRAAGTSEAANAGFTQRRELSGDGRYVIKQITRTDDGRTFVERVRLFEPADLKVMLARAGLVVKSELGDYAGGELSSASPRAILMAQRR